MQRRLYTIEFLGNVRAKECIMKRFLYGYIVKIPKDDFIMMKSSFGIFGTYSGIKVEGALVNERIIAVISGGILFGPWVGIITGLVLLIIFRI